MLTHVRLIIIIPLISQAIGFHSIPHKMFHQERLNGFQKASQCRLLYIASKLHLRLVCAQLNSLIHPISSRTCNPDITLKLGSFAEALSEFLTEKYLLSFSSVLERSGKYLIILMVFNSAGLSLRPGRRKKAICLKSNSYLTTSLEHGNLPRWGCNLFNSRPLFKDLATFLSPITTTSYYITSQKTHSHQSKTEKLMASTKARNRISRFGQIKLYHNS